MNCSKHHDQEITWVCLERVCDQRVMCSRCAVKIHNKDHKVEELQSVVQSGILESFHNNPSNNTYGVNRLCNQIENQIKYPQPIDVLQIIQMVEQNLSRVADAIRSMSTTLVITTQEIYKNEESQRLNVLDLIGKYEQQLVLGNFSSGSDLGDILDNAFKTIIKYADQKEKELQDQHTSDLAILNKKYYINQIVRLTILHNLQSSFETMISAYFDNSFTKEFCGLFEMQLQTLSFDKNQQDIETESDLQSMYQEQAGGNIQDCGGFLDYMHKKCLQDYENIDYTLRKFIHKLSEGLKYVIQLPIQSEMHHAQFQSPMKRQPQQQQFHPFQTPVYMPPFPPQMMMPPTQFQPMPHPQQYMISPKPMRDENFGNHLSKGTKPLTQTDHMAMSQIVYMVEEPHLPNQRRVEVQPVCQRALQLKDNEQVKGNSRIVGDNPQKVKQTLTTCLNKISNVTNKSINR